MALPEFILAADNHNIGNTGTSWLDLDTWTQKLGNAGKLAATSVLSGANSFYNTGVAVGNWIGDKFGANPNWRENDTSAWISAIDSDLGRYYRDNQSAADLGGFILGSLIPGLGGVKLLNAGQTALKGISRTGLLGGNMGKALNVLTPNTKKYLDLAAQEINASTTALSLLNKNTTKALANGLWQNTLEAAAFETAAQVSMFRSPILEQQDGWDIASNIAVGGMLGGAIGGAFGSAKLFGQLKSARASEDKLRLPFINRPTFAVATSDSEKIISLSYDNTMSAVPVKITGPDGEIVNNYAVNKQLYDDKVRKNNNDMRTSINNLAGGNKVLGNIIANITHGAHAQTVFENFSGAVKIVQVTETSSFELAMNRALGKGEIPDIAVSTRLVKGIGEDAGTVIDELPTVLSLGDLYKGKDKVLHKVRSYGFKPGQLWDATSLKGITAHLEGEARHIWAQHLAKPLKEGAEVHLYDIPLLERAYKDNFLNIKIVSGEGPTLEVITPTSRRQLYDIIKESKITAANKLLEDMSLNGNIPVEQGTTAAAKIVNTRRSFLEGDISDNEFDDLFEMQTTARNYLDSLKAKGLTIAGEEADDPAFLPKYAKVVYAINKDVAATTESVVDAMVLFKEQQKLYTDSAKNVVAKILGNISDSLLDITDTALFNANRNGAGAGLFSFENANYGTLGSSMAVIGSVTRRAIEAERKKVGDYLTTSLTKLGQKQEAAIEFESINQQITRSAKQWKFDEETRTLYSVEKEGIEPEYIPIDHDETLEVIKSHIQLAGQRTASFKEIRAVQGLTDNKHTDVFRPIRPDLKQYPHFFFVRDPQVTGTGHMTMVHAASEKELSMLRDRVPSNYEVLFKSDTEEFKKARGEYEFSRTLHENYIDSDLKNKGVFSNFFPKSDPEKIINDILQQHLRDSDVLVRETVNLRYEPQFNWLRDVGQTYSKTETSKFASNRKIVEDTADNPFFNYIKTALDISKASEMGLLHSFNKTLDTAVSKAVGAIHDTWNGIKAPADLGKLNEQLDKYGMKPAYYDAALHVLANHQAPRGELTKFVRSANSLLSLFTLGLDPLNSLNNAIGSNILRFTELNHLVKAINAGDTEVAGELGNLMKINVPGTTDTMFAPTKLVQKAISNFWNDKDNVLMNRYRNDGLIKDRVEQLKLLVDDFTLNGTETVAELDKRIKTGFSRAKELAGNAADRGERLAGNKLAEEFNRFISADVMRQITDIGIKKGLMDDATAKAYINTFVNRVEGNILASQRPLIFQGPIGQAIGLFQSYQFNLLQQLFRYTAEGSKKDLGMLLGLQSTLYGLQSLPAFQFINTHVVGQLSGNKEHRDLYDGVYGVTGRTAGDWILYGIPSNILQANIYSRGDINPRQITVLPTSMQETPIVQGWGKFLANIKSTVSNINNGGNVWQSLIQGLEHNGISRPLAGFAQVLQGFPDGVVQSTTKDGSILYSNDLMTWASLTRLAGGRPLDEAITNDSMFRVKAYQAANSESKKKLSEAVKTTLVGGNVSATEEQMQGFAQKFAELGGKQDGFNRYIMSLYKNANVTQSQQLQQSLSNPFVYKMQLLMGGDEE